MFRTSKYQYSVAAVILLLLALAFTAADTTAQTPVLASLKVTDVKAVQVVEDVPLVVGKATVLKIQITAGGRTQAKITATLGNSTRTTTNQLNSGANTLYIPVDPPGAPGTLQVIAKVTSTTSAGGNQVTKTVEVVGLSKNSLKVILLPVDWTTQDLAANFPSRYNSFVSQSSDFFKATYPIPEGNFQIIASRSNYLLTADERAIVDGVGNLNWQNITAMYTSIALAGRREMPDTDLVVGVLPPKWFARNLHDPTVVGLELQAVRQAVANQVDSDYATLAHEAGHVFGRVDDYDFNKNPIKIGNRLDAPGYWVSKARSISPGAKPTFFSFMGASDASSQFWVDRSTYLAIMQTLQSGVLP